MIPNSYTSFEEIDEQLKILSLQKNIYKELIKLNLKSTKNNLKAESIKTELRGVLQEKILAFVANNVLKKLRRN
ncbi:hypothetical protein JBL43_15675 [Aureibaculum sp. A20]|uniref:Uncharacterized protein n=1 Tax=Aureibaculum flavum TaxID=2795986 RepID=A0ABS0WUM4_9FLAO|nr:DUF6327 family protein [Aureibaculum flavum]MBJ2175692.1 hypothetical protein [Aureibaculum flavum]